MNWRGRVLVVSFGTAVVISSVALATKHRGSAPGPQSDPRGETEVGADDELRMELAALRAEIGRVRQVAAATASVANAPAAASPGTVGATASAAKTPEEEAAEAKRFFGKLESRAAAESTDTAWSGKMEGVIAHAFSREAAPGTTVRSVTCKTSMCVVTVAADDMNAQVRLAEVISAREPFASSAGNYFRYQQDGTLSTTIYLLRPGARPIDSE